MAHANENFVFKSWELKDSSAKSGTLEKDCTFIATFDYQYVDFNMPFDDESLIGTKNKIGLDNKEPKSENFSMKLRKGSKATLVANQGQYRIQLDYYNGGGTDHINLYPADGYSTYIADDQHRIVKQWSRTVDSNTTMYAGFYKTADYCTVKASSQTPTLGDVKIEG